LQLLRFRIALGENLRETEHIAASLGINLLEVMASATMNREEAMGQQLGHQHCTAWGRISAGVEQTMMAASSSAAVHSFMAPAMAVARAVLTKVAEKAAQESSLGSMMTFISGANPAAARVGNPDEGLSLDLLEQATAGLKRIQQLSLLFTVFFLNALSPYQHTQMVVACEWHSQLQIFRAQGQTPRSESCVACMPCNSL
jgi:hypothetical protein